MLVTIDPLSAETLAALRAPRELPAGMVFQPVSMEASLGRADAFRLIATLILSDEVANEAAADWLWAQIDGAVPLVVETGGVRARVGEPAALAWLIGKAREAE